MEHVAYIKYSWKIMFDIWFLCISELEDVHLIMLPIKRNKNKISIEHELKIMQSYNLRIKSLYPYLTDFREYNLRFRWYRPWNFYRVCCLYIQLPIAILRFQNMLHCFMLMLNYTTATNICIFMYKLQSVQHSSGKEMKISL